MRVLRAIGTLAGALLAFSSPCAAADPASGWPANRVSPAATGSPHACEYPAAALDNSAGGSTVVQFTIETDGTTRDASVDVTSGNAELDKAAVSCVSTWRYKPASQDGKPVAVIWKAQVQWIMPTIIDPVGYNEAAHRCGSAFLLAQRRSDATFDLFLSFFVDTDGNVEDARVARSSQDFELDTAFLKCVRDWIYTPAKHDTTAIRVVWGALFHMSPQTGPAFREGPARIHFCSPRLRESDAEGTTVLNFRITESGMPERVTVAESSGSRALDSAAKACAAGWLYPPESRGSAAPVENWSAQITWKNGQSIVADLGSTDEPHAPIGAKPLRSNNNGT